ncbi:DUF4238 domain-containing protein [Rhodovulum sulfidophilum]|nr:DUF4238 domain-containing protein [Rhodovulum sulfidophilum]
MAEHLRRWCPDRKNIWYTTPKGKVAYDSVKGLAKQEFFYKATILPPHFPSMVKLLFRNSSPELKKQQERELETYLKIQLLHQLPIMKQNAEERDASVKVLMCNSLENTHAHIERDARSVINSLAKGDFKALSNRENLLNFLVYFGHQITRTRAFKDKGIASLEAVRKEVGHDHGIAETLSDGWWFVSFIFGMNIGWSLYVNREAYKHCLLLNVGEEDFITSDQPIVNIHPMAARASLTAPDDDACDFFYAITPRVGFAINKSNAFSEGVSEVSEDFVSRANAEIAKHSQFNIFTTSEIQARTYRKLVNLRAKEISSLRD